jgi:4-aminobutyrate aminotransferase-like enzyme
MRAVAASRGIPRAARGMASIADKTYSAAEALSILDKHFSPAVARAPKGNDLVCSFAKGSWVHDVNGKKYLDLQTGIGVSSTGHSHPR